MCHNLWRGDDAISDELFKGFHGEEIGKGARLKGSSFRSWNDELEPEELKGCELLP